MSNDLVDFTNALPDRSQGNGVDGAAQITVPVLAELVIVRPLPRAVGSSRATKLTCRSVVLASATNCSGCRSRISFYFPASVFVNCRVGVPCGPGGSVLAVNCKSARDLPALMRLRYFLLLWPVLRAGVLGSSITKARFTRPIIRQSFSRPSLAAVEPARLPPQPGGYLAGGHLRPRISQFCR